MKITDVLRELGARYCIRIMDNELVIYRDFGDYDVEVSGLEFPKASFKAVIYLWNKRQGFVDETFEVKSLPELESKLNEISSRYSNQLPD